MTAENSGPLLDNALCGALCDLALYESTKNGENLPNFTWEEACEAAQEWKRRVPGLPQGPYHAAPCEQFDQDNERLTELQERLRTVRRLTSGIESDMARTFNEIGGDRLACVFEQSGYTDAPKLVEILRRGALQLRVGEIAVAQIVSAEKSGQDPEKICRILSCLDPNRIIAASAGELFSSFAQMPSRALDAAPDSVRQAFPAAAYVLLKSRQDKPASAGAC